MRMMEETKITPRITLSKFFWLMMKFSRILILLLGEKR
jgi:hypothetical protein